MPVQLADRLSVARHHHFVGRDDELALFRSLLGAPELPFFVLYLSGPAGVGKTALLQEFASLCAQAGTPECYIDGRNLGPSPEAFMGALQRALGLAPPASPLQTLISQPQRHVILIDTYEALSPLDNWLQSVFLPQLPENVLMVLASTNPPAAAWRADSGWQSLIHVLPLRNLTPAHSRAYLSSRGIPTQEHEAILDFTHGHPLALSLVADVCLQRPGSHFQPAEAPDMIQALLERLVQKVPGPAHRTALEACALARVTTEALLAEMLGLPDPSTGSGYDAHELFQWLRGLSFIESSPEGLFPHDLVREALVTDLHWRNPDWYAELHRRARNYYARHVQSASGKAQQRVLFDYIFLHRDNPAVRPFFEWHTDAGVVTDTMRHSDLPALVTMVAEHEGQDSACLAEHWLSRDICRQLVFRDPRGEPAGFLALVALQDAALEDIDADPATRAAWRYLQDHAPLRLGEGATLLRFWMVRDGYQAVSAIQSLIFVNAAQHYLATPGLAFTFFPCAEPDFWAPMFGYIDLRRIPEADFEVDGHRFGVYGHDWRAMPPLTWLALLAEREVGLAPQASPPPGVNEALVVLSRPDFEVATRRALHDFSLPDALQTNPLLRSKLVIERVGHSASVAERVAALQSLVREAAHRLQSSPRETKCYRAVYHTYLQPAPTQEKAAELLDVPFSTFRRHLGVGIGRVVDILWQWETGGRQ
jgi:hypothetical protein